MSMLLFLDVAFVFLPSCHPHALPLASMGQGGDGWS